MPKERSVAPKTYSTFPANKLAINKQNAPITKNIYA